jgi:hypothetical protein
MRMTLFEFGEPRDGQSGQRGKFLTSETRGAAPVCGKAGGDGIDTGAP